MITRPISVGTLVRIAREGVVSANPAGSVSDVLKPDVADAAWSSLGTVDEGESEYTEELREIKTPINGRKHLSNVLITGGDLKLTFTLEDYSDVVSALRFGHLPLAGNGGQFNPLERVKPFKAWVKLQETDGTTGDNVTVLDVWCFLQLTGALSMNSTGPKPQVVARVLYSTLNTGTLLVA